MIWVAGLGLGIAVGLCPGYALLLAAPGVVVGGVAYVVVDEGVGLLSVGVHLVLAVTALRIRNFRRFFGQAAALCGDQVIVLSADVLVGIVKAAWTGPGRRPGVDAVLPAERVFHRQPSVVELQSRKASFIQADHVSVRQSVTVGVVTWTHVQRHRFRLLDRKSVV